jgi:hypothetical protein
MHIVKFLLRYSNQWLIQGAPQLDLSPSRGAWRKGKGNAGAPMISNRPPAAIGKNGGYRWLRFRVIAKKYLKFYE